MLVQHLAALGAGAPVDPRTLGDDVTRFGGALAVRDPVAAGQLSGALAAVTSAAGGADLAAAVGKAQDAAARARAVLTPDRDASRPVLIAELLLAHDGVVDSLRRSLDDRSAYPAGWRALRLVEAEWGLLRTHASTERAQEWETVIAKIRRFYPNPTIPEDIDPEYAEDVVGMSHHLVTILEQVSGAELDFGRDLPALVEALSVAVTRACDAFARPDIAAAGEAILAARDWYHAALEPVLEFVEPTVAMAIEWDLDNAPTECGAMLADLRAAGAAVTP